VHFAQGHALSSFQVFFFRHTHHLESEKLALPCSPMDSHVLQCKEYLSASPSQTVFLFPSEKTKGALSERMPGYIVKKYADGAKLADVSPHDLRHRFGYRMAEPVPLHRLIGANYGGMIHWTRPHCTSGEPNTIYNRRLRSSRGLKGGTGYAGQPHRFSRATSR
jgi:hypothetical protein